MFRKTAETGVIRVGAGDIGGRARGLDFLARALPLSFLEERFKPHRIQIDRPWVLGTEVFERFVRDSRLKPMLRSGSDDEVLAEFAASEFPEDVARKLEGRLDKTSGPLEVRSSSLNEDTAYHPFSGLYRWAVLPMGEQTVRMRLLSLLGAVRGVYASLWFQGPKRYMNQRVIPVEEERMAVVIHRVPGRMHDGVWYPELTGVARGRNHFPIGSQTPDEGVVLACMGFWLRSRSEDRAVRFSPRRPTVRPEAYVPRDLLRGSQRRFYSIDPSVTRADPVVRQPLSAAESHGTLRYLVSTWVEEEQTFHPSTMKDGRRVVTLEPLLKRGVVPLAEMLDAMLVKCRELYGGPVEIRFALSFEGHAGSPPATLHITQVLPQTLRLDQNVAIPDPVPGTPLLRTRRTLGNGRDDEIRHVVYVPPDPIDPLKAPEVAEQVSRINEELVLRGERCLLVGPGRWGSSNRKLGIPVSYPQIRSARVVCEVSTTANPITPSQGTHFFRNIVAGNVFYLAVVPSEADLLDRKWFESRPHRSLGPFVRHLELDRPLHVVVDGSAGEALIWIDA
jgi:hypothetical protein